MTNFIVVPERAEKLLAERDTLLLESLFHLRMDKGADDFYRRVMAVRGGEG